MRRQLLKYITDKALDHVISEKGKESNIGIYYGKRVGGRKELELVKAGPHIDAAKAENVYLSPYIKDGKTRYMQYYDLKEVIVYNRLNSAKYHRLLLSMTRYKLRETAQLGLPASNASLNDQDIERLIEFSRGEQLSYFGRAEYKLLPQIGE